jgi:hypothetical protein
VAVTELVNRLAAAWRQRVGTASRGALVGLLLFAVLGGAHLARLGTPVARGLTLGAFGLVALLALGRWLNERRDWRSLRRAVRRVLGTTDGPLAERALRAIGLVERTELDAAAGSPDLARLHLERLMARASLEAVEQTAERRAFRWHLAALALFLGSAAAFFLGPVNVLEGLDVLAARHGRAPVPMTWLDFTRVAVQPPGYLRTSAQMIGASDNSEAAEGSVVTVHGNALRGAPKFVLTDGQHETAFVSDAAGGLVARWTLDHDAKLRVAARFGDVLVPEPDSIDLKAVADELPIVRLDGAPKTLQLRDVDRLALRYTASDDHGLTEVDLVLRSGNHEERRVLARPGGDKTSNSGGYALGAGDPFLQRMFLPVLITIEARDNDPRHAGQWGRSAAITIVPPPIGEPEADRYRAIKAVCNALVDELARELRRPSKLDATRDRARVHRIAAELRAAAEKAYDGLRVPNGLAAFLRGQAEQFARSPRPGESTVRKTEDVTLAVDAVLTSLAAYDAGVVSKRLADAAEQAAQGARQARDTEQEKRGRARLDAAITALTQGTRSLLELGKRGRDIGGVAVADRHRIERARAAGDMLHAELAARHLADRLRRPDPSFASSGAGVESGGRRSAPGKGSASRAADRFNQLVSELEQLAADHQNAIARVQQALDSANAAADQSALRDEAKRRAETLRRAVSRLPVPGAEQDSARGAAALGREQALAMADLLERLAFDDAVDSGHNAASSFGDATRKARAPRGPSDWLDLGQLGAAQSELDGELKWAEAHARELQQSVNNRARADLDQASQREQALAQRAGNLAARGKNGASALPGEVVKDLERAESIMQEAAGRLSGADGQRALELQRQAQRLLEQADTGKTTDHSNSSARSHSQGSGGRGIRTDGMVPPPDSGKAARDFRRRVLEGLGRQSGGRLAPAIRRYAEGLLQ